MKKFRAKSKIDVGGQHLEQIKPFLKMKRAKWINENTNESLRRWPLVWLPECDGNLTDEWRMQLLPLSR